ncbi:MAG TPA: hypothetical protein PLE74_03235 [Candidatus Cloacimonadota bacterium]|nr:hypothetical protein [Candidatus Cloacimonadota bacterium]HPT71274.1 hypothetical protein [Candidatus Cloacimonadota bacterium]
MNRELKTPTVALIEEYFTKFKENERYYKADKAIMALIEQFPHNNDIEHILLKVVTINSLYNTNIYATYQLAQHIHNINIDNRLEHNESSLVAEISRISLNGKAKNLISFASKYCSFHKPCYFPKCDSFVKRLLCAYRNQDQKVKFKNAEINDYASFKGIIDSFKTEYGLQRISYNKLDKFLWLYGKDVFSNQDSGE